MKKERRTFIITSVMILLPILAGMFLWEQLPAEMATSFGMDGTANGWSGKGFAVFGLPAFLLTLHVFCVAATHADPKFDNINDKMRMLVLWLIPIISLFVAIPIYGYALGVQTNFSVYGMAFVGVVFIFVGNYLPKCRQNYTLGIKMPWTLHDEENWNHTHRMAGFLWVIGGFVLLVNAFLQWNWLFSVTVVVMVAVPVGYSYLYYRKQNGVI